MKLKEGISASDKEKNRLGNIGRFSFVMLLLGCMLILALVVNVNIGSVSVAV